MQFRKLKLPGVLELTPFIHSDQRGELVKLIHRPQFEAHGLNSDFPEVVYTISAKSVIRGLHCQLPPHDHLKVIHCASGAIVDVLLDLRCNSPMYRQYISVELSASQRNGLYVPPGIAHGFYVREGPAMLIYHMSHPYAPESDTGIRWNSFGFQWPSDGILSSRDQQLPGLSEFESPFVMSPDS